MNSNPPDGKTVPARIKAGALAFQKGAENTLRMFQYLILLVALVFAGWFFVKIVVFGLSLLVSPAELTIMPFDGTETQKKQAPAILSAKLRELKTRGRMAPTGYGLLTVPLLESGPQQTEQTEDKALAELDKIQLKIKDVDVSALIRAFDALLTPARYELRGSVVDLPTSLSVICQLVRREKVMSSWEATAKIPAPDAASGAAQTSAAAPAALEDLLDQVLYQMVFDFAHDAELKKQWKISISRAESFANWRSLRAYVRGLRALRSYQENLDTHDLQEAYEFFDSLAISDPRNPYGVYFRGLALSEDRREAEAVDNFLQLQRLLQRQEKPENWKSMLYEARLHEATARLKLYTMKEAEKAVAILNRLCADLTRELAISPTSATQVPAEQAEPAAGAEQQIVADNTGPKSTVTTAKEDSYTAKLLTVCHAQLGYTHGTILSFKELKVPPAPKLAKKHADAMKESLDQADVKFNSVGGDWASDREKMDVRFRIDNARGYGLYRQAFFDAPDGDSYSKRCQEAIDVLEKADEARPNHYEVLQNMAMIYADDRFATPTSLLHAQRLFERTKKFVPKDYYQYEQLAAIHCQLMELCSTDECRKAEIEAGSKEGREAIKLRGESGSAFHGLALFALKTWEIDKRTETAATAALDAFQNAMPYRQDDSGFQDKYIGFLERLAETRKSAAAGLNEVIERAIALGRVPRLDAERKKKLVEFANEQVQKSLELTKDAAKPENKEPHARAEKLEQEVTAL